MVIKMKIIILGSGGYGKTVADVATQLGYKIMFLDDSILGYQLSSFVNYIPKLTDNTQETYFIPAFGNNEFRLEWCNKIEKENGKLATIIHPTAYVSPTATIHEGTVILPHAIINTDVTVGKGCIINCGAIIDHGCVIEEGCHICLGAIVKAGNSISTCTKVEAGQVIEKRSKIKTPVKKTQEDKIQEELKHGIKLEK